MKKIMELESLVEELLKDAPREVWIEKKMKKLDLQYCEDPAERINRVLDALHPSRALDFQED